MFAAGDLAVEALLPGGVTGDLVGDLRVQVFDLFGSFCLLGFGVWSACHYRSAGWFAADTSAIALSPACPLVGHAMEVAARLLPKGGCGAALHGVRHSGVGLVGGIGEWAPQPG